MNFMKKIQWGKVSWYFKLLFLALLIILPFLGFYIGNQYQKMTSINQQKKTEKETFEKNEVKEQKPTFDSFEKDCGKPTLIVYVFKQVSSVTQEEARVYFKRNNIAIISQSGSEFIVRPPAGERNFWGQKIQDDKIGDATLDNVGCDFAGE